MDNDRQALIAQMMEVTNCDEVVAQDYLTRTNYDVETAVRHFFDGTIPPQLVNDSSPSVSSESSSQPSLPSSPEHVNTVSSRAVLPGYHSYLQLFAQVITLPIRFPLIVFNYVYEWFFGGRQPVYVHIYTYIGKVLPQYDMAKKALFYRHGLQNLRADLPNNNWKWLVAYVHNPKESSTFLEALLNSNFADTVRNRGGVFFGCVMGSDDASRLRPDRTFGRARKSCILIFVIRGSTLTRKLLIEELSNPEAVFLNVDLALIDLIADEADRQAQERVRTESRRLMEEQNREYQESLQRDLERIAKTKSEEEAAKKAQEEEERKQREAAERLNKVETYKKEISEDTTPTEGAHDLLIRFPTGKKVIKFNADDIIEKIFDEAMKSELCPIYFQMHQTFPKRAVPCLPHWYHEILVLEELEPKDECRSTGLTFQEAGITHGSMVYIDNL